MARKGAEADKRPATIFSSYRLGPLYLKNRLVALPVYTGYAYPDGTVSPRLLEHYRRLAASGVSLVVVANAAVASNGVTSNYNLRIDRDAYIPGLKKLAATIRNSGALACIQLNHAGRFAKTAQPLLPAALNTANLAFNIASLKDFMNFFPLEERFELTRFFLKQANSWRRKMTADDIEKVISKFGDAAVRAYEAGFDIIELHGANGYLLSQFLSASTNKIPSGFGGDFKSRMTFPLAVIAEIKKRLPDGFPIGFRLMLIEWVPEGIDLPESLAFARRLAKENIGYLSVSVGSYNSIFAADIKKRMSRPGYLRPEMVQLRRTVNIPIIISGRIIHPGLAEEILRQRVADLIGLGRPLRADIDWVKKAARGTGQKITICKNCNWCLKRVVLEQGFNCQRWPRLAQLQTDLDHQLLSRNYNSLWVIADSNDRKSFETVLPGLYSESLIRSASLPPSILFLQTEAAVPTPDAGPGERLAWSRKLAGRIGFAPEGIHLTTQAPAGAIEKLIGTEIQRGPYGIVLIGHNPGQVWRERLLYRERRKVIGLLNTGGGRPNILVPVDLSPTTLLVLMFVRRSFMGRADFQFNFVHVSNQPQGPVEQRWKELKKVLDFDENARLQIVPQKDDIAGELFNRVTADRCGTIIMGKRGVSGIKRWLLGSVSAGILRRLTDQALFLVD